MIDTTHIMKESDNNEALTKLDNKILECYNECCPIKTKTISSKNQIKQWTNHSIENNIIKRQNNFKLYQQRLIPEREYKLFRNFVNNQIRIAKKKYYETFFLENKNNLRPTWKVVNKVLSKTVNRIKLEI